MISRRKNETAVLGPAPGMKISAVLPVVAAMLFGLFLSWNANSQVVPTSKIQAWQNDIRVFEERWNALIAQRPGADAAKWAALESDLKSLSAKYGQRTEEHVRKLSAENKPSTIGASAGLNECPSRDDIPGYRCYLFPGPKGVCRYVCTPISKPKL